MREPSWKVLGWAVLWIIVIGIAFGVYRSFTGGNGLKFGISGSMTTGGFGGSLHADNSKGFTPAGVYDVFVYDSNGSLVKSMKGRVSSSGIPQWSWNRNGCKGRYVPCPEGMYSVLSVDEASGKVARASFTIQPAPKP